MIEGRTSHTAQEQAYIRALESLAPEEKRVCYDPLAAEFLDDRVRRTYYRTRNSKFWTKVWLKTILHKDPSGTRAEAVARTRYIDDYLRASVESGVQQVVILGAGYDSRAYRLKALERVSIFEVDHPDTQTTKVDTIKRIFGHVPSWVRYVPVDFRKEKLDEKLSMANYRRDLMSLFIWEGVTMYLTAEDVDETLRFVTTDAGRGSSIIFNYWYKSAVDGETKWKWATPIKKHCEQIGEPITFGIDGDRIEEFLTARGFSQVKRATPSILDQMYFQGSGTARKACPFSEIVSATTGL